MRACVYRSASSLVLVVSILFSGTSAAQAQDIEPRSFSAVPIGTNFLVMGYSSTTGDVLVSPSLPVTNVQAAINRYLFGYERTFDLGGHTASLTGAVPYYAASITGDVMEQSRYVRRVGLGDLSMRFAWNLIGDPALTPALFARRKPDTTLGLSVSVIAPTGAYDPSHLINISTHRWNFFPQIGIEKPFGKAFADASGGVWLFTNNNDFFGGHTRGQDPYMDLETDVGYNFRPGLWLSGSATYYTGGQTYLDGIPKHDGLANGRYGLTLSVPFARGFSTKLSWSNWFTQTIGGKWQTIGLNLQYRWFDR